MTKYSMKLFKDSETFKRRKPPSLYWRNAGNKFTVALAENGTDGHCLNFTQVEHVPCDGKRFDMLLLWSAEDVQILPNGTGELSVIYKLEVGKRDVETMKSLLTNAHIMLQVGDKMKGLRSYRMPVLTVQKVMFFKPIFELENDRAGMLQDALEDINVKLELQNGRAK
jgi:hypothetical protein